MGGWFLVRGLFIFIVSTGCLLFCWASDAVGTRTKCVFTVFFVAAFVPLLIPDYEYLAVLAHCVLGITVGGTTFGIDWLMQR